MAAALTGATVNQLRHWRSPRAGPLLAPEIQSAPRALYSFLDVLALRTCVRLRRYASLQKIRSAVATLRDLGAEGVPPEEICQYYPAVSAEAARDAIDFALYVDSFDRGKMAA